MIKKAKKKEKDRKKARIEWANRKEQLTKDEINENFNEFVNIILTPNSNNIFEIDLDFGHLKTEMSAMTGYIHRLLQMIKPIPVDCKYYFIDIQDYRKCFVAIRKVFVRSRKDFNDAEDKVIDLLTGKYDRITPGFKKKVFRPEARHIFYFLDRRIPMDLVMFKVIELNEAMRNDKAKADPIQQTKNSDMLKFTSGVRHQCTLVRNLMFSYLLSVSRVKTIFQSFNNFSNAFSDFDKQHKEFYHKAKDAVGNQEFHEPQGIKVVDIQELDTNNMKENKQEEDNETLHSVEDKEDRKKKSGKTGESEKSHEGSSKDEDKSEESETSGSSVDSDSIEEKFIPPENIGRRAANIRGNKAGQELQPTQGRVGGECGPRAQKKKGEQQARWQRRELEHVDSEGPGRAHRQRLPETGGAEHRKERFAGDRCQGREGGEGEDAEADHSEEPGGEGRRGQVEEGG